MVTLIVLLALIAFLVFGTPVAFALTAAAVIGLLLSGDPLSSVAQVYFDTFAIYELSAIPLFILMSQILVHGRVGDHLFEAIRRWVGHLPGGVAIATILSCGFFAAVAGSSTTTAAVVGTTAIPAMAGQGYPRRFAYGLVAGGGTLGILIPPSIPFVLYAAVTGTSVGALYLAGIVPGLVMMATFAVYVIAFSSITGRLPRAPREPIRSALAFSLQHIGALLLPVIVLGSIYAGIVTPTEAAAVGVVYSLLLCLLVYRSIRMGHLAPIIFDTVRISTMILIVIAGALILGRVITTLQVAADIVAGLQALNVGKWTFLILINLIWILMGDFLDVGSIMLITLPIFYPVAVALQIDPIWFAVIMVINMELATITPPVGLNLFVIMGITGEKDFMEVLKGTIPFMLLILLNLAIIMLFPSIATWLPGK